MMKQLSLAKQRLRQKIKAFLSKHRPADRRKRSRRIFNKLFREQAIKEAKTVLFYSALPQEVDTRQMIDRALRQKMIVVLPRVEPKKKVLNLHQIRNRRTDLQKGSYAVFEPKDCCRRVRPSGIDCAVIPGLAFDAATRRRLGRGGGYYDRLIPKLKRAKKIGLAFSFQLVKKVPAARRDRKVDIVLTD